MTPAGAVSPATAVPVTGAPAGLRVDGREHWLWWGPDVRGQDVVACRDGRVLSYPTAASCADAAASRGWAAAEELEDGVARRLADLDPVRAWLRGGALRLDSGSALELWNWADDLARSTHRPGVPRSRVADGCYRQLFAAEVPWFFDLTGYRPTWTRRSHRVLRSSLSHAVHLLRSSLPR